jgi:hypothetical protein
MMGLRDIDAFSGLWITPRPSRPSLYGKHPKATQFHAIAPDQCCCYLVENGTDGYFNVPGEQMRILLGDAHNQF